MSFVNVGERIREIRKARGLNQDQLAELASLNRVTVAKYETGRVEPGAQSLAKIADALGVSVDSILGRSSDGEILPNGLLGIVRGAVPVIGAIACGKPILAAENVEDYVDLPEGVRADFALRCKGDSMVPTFLDGDVVLIRGQPDVENGQIAAVLIDDEATLKRIHHVPGGIILSADNQSAFAPMVLRAGDAVDVRILGLATGYVRMF